MEVDSRKCAIAVLVTAFASVPTCLLHGCKDAGKAPRGGVNSPASTIQVTSSAVETKTPPVEARVEVDPQQLKLEQLVLSKGYQEDGWQSQPGHLSGVAPHTVHGFVEVHFDQAISAWLQAQPLPKNPTAIPEGGTIVALQYGPADDAGKRAVVGARAMVRSAGASKSSTDGWFWSTMSFKSESGKMVVDRERSDGMVANSSCFACHASANDSMVFLDAQGPLPSSHVDEWKPDADLAPRVTPVPERQRIAARANADPEFLSYYDIKDEPTLPPDEFFPSQQFDHAWSGKTGGANSDQIASYITSDQCRGCHGAAELLSNTSPDMWYPEPDPEQALVDGTSTPDAKTYRNFSAHGEWSASLNALSGRDPVWHAQVDFERRLRPELADFTTDTCFSCHGPMAGRQLKIDEGEDALFTIDKFYSTAGKDSKYGALARDGVSCAVCHQIASDELGVDPKFEKLGEHYRIPSDLKTYTAMFPNPGSDTPFWGPYSDENIASAAMDRTLGRRAKYGNVVKGSAQIRESKLCGSCHTVLVPALPVGYQLPEQYKTPFEDPAVHLAFEQTTYFEWRNSAYENEIDSKRNGSITCQGCHMASHHDPKAKKNLAERIVNMESDRFPPVRGRSDASISFQKHDPIYRHVLLGINLFVFEMYEQFQQPLGVLGPDPRTPKNTLDPVLNARDWIENHAERATAEVRVTGLAEKGDQLEAEVEVTNFAGHKFPTGAGFRRAFLTFEVLDGSGKVLWASGRANSLGVILGPDGKPLESEETLDPSRSQPHHQVITAPTQVQIYEVRAQDSEGKLQTTVLGIFDEQKDNRILPLGWSSVENPKGPSRNLFAMAPHGAAADDPDYQKNSANGQDHVTYRVPLSEISGWSSVRVQLFYQTIPPYYLRDRFQTGSDKRFPVERDMRRLIHMASRLNLADTPAAGWKLGVGRPAALKKGQAPQRRLTQKDVRKKLQEHYDYLDL